MTTTLIANLEALIGTPRDGALLRYSLGNEWLKAGEPLKAADCLRAALERDAHYSAAWKLLGKALADAGKTEEARSAFGQGIATAEQRGDIQAAKEMRVFLRRLDKADAKSDAPAPLRAQAPDGRTTAASNPEND